MRLYKVVILINFALAIGFFFGFLWWGREVGRLTRELATARQTIVVGQASERSWSVRGVVRIVAPEINRIIITHEEIPDLMRAMTMAFEVENSKLLDGLISGDSVRFTLKERNGLIVLVAIEKEDGP